MIPPLLLFALKVLGCSIGIYIIAIFIASIKKLLPFLTIIASLATIFLVWYIQLLNRQDLIFVYTIMLICINFLYMGESFFSYRVVKNTYMIVGVERRWKSLFADFDEYIVHYSPVEAGGFFSNVIGSGFIFSLVTFFVFPQNPSLGYALPVYYILMSLMDIVYLFWFEITGVLRFFLQSLIIIATAVSPVYVKEIMNKITNTEGENVSYLVCKIFYDVNFNNSYYFEYSKTEINESHDENKECFIYNKDLDAAGYFKEYYYDYDEFIPLFYEVIYKDDRFGEYISFVDYSDGLDGFNYNGIATKTKSVLVYKEIDEKYPYKDYFKFNKDIFENSTYKIEENTLKIQYKNELEDHSYTTQFLYNLDENKNVNSFKGVECEIKDDNYIYTYIYQPRYDEKELKAYFATEEKRLNGYIIKAEDLRRFFEGEKSVVINQNVDPNDLSLVQEKLYELFYELNSETNIFETYDFVLDYITDTDILEYAITDILVNDVDSGMSVLYDNDLVKGIKAAGNNNFTKYQPQVYIYNKLNSGYDLEFNEAIADVSDIIHEDIYNVFDELSMYAVPLCDYYYENTYLVAEYNVYKTSYKFYFKKRNHEFVLNKIDIKRSRGNYHYHYVAYVENKFDIDRSMFK